MIHYYRYLLVKMKVFNYSELHFSEVTSFKIHTLILVTYNVMRNNFSTEMRTHESRSFCKIAYSLLFATKN